jgi:hypothetical protein
MCVDASVSAWRKLPGPTVPHLARGFLTGNRFSVHLEPLRDGVVLHHAAYFCPHKVVVIELWT